MPHSDKMKMGVSYSTLCADELLSRLVCRYRVEDPLSCQFWERGVNDTYRLYCKDDIYSLRLYRHNLRSKDAIEFEITALNYLKDRGANVAYPIATRDDRFISEVDAPEGLRYAIITAHAKGAKPNYDKAENARLFGASLARLHHCSDGFETVHQRDRIEGGSLLDFSLDVITPFLNDNQADLEFFMQTADRLRSAVNDVDGNVLDFGFCHGDCHGHNVHDDHGLFTHYDFDCCGMGYRIYDLATFKWGCLNNDNSTELWSLFLEGYLSAREFQDSNLRLLDTFVVIRHLWWMALIMGNAGDFGYSDACDGFIKRNKDHIRKFLESI